MPVVPVAGLLLLLPLPQAPPAAAEVVVVELAPRDRPPNMSEVVPPPA